MIFLSTLLHVPGQDPSDTADWRRGTGQGGTETETASFLYTAVALALTAHAGRAMGLPLLRQHAAVTTPTVAG